MYQILVIEDDEDIRKILKNFLCGNGYGVILAEDGVDGIAKFHECASDLILLDVMLPKIDGFGVLELIRRESEIPVILLTALEEEAYQIRGLDPAGRRVYVAQEAGETLEPELTQKEFELLHVLLISKGIVLTRQKLLNLVWGDDYFGEERIVDTHIKNLRKKLGTNYISIIRGVGYRIDKEAKSKSDD